MTKALITAFWRKAYADVWVNNWPLRTDTSLTGTLRPLCKQYNNFVNALDGSESINSFTLNGFSIFQELITYGAAIVLATLPCIMQTSTKDSIVLL